MYEVWGYSTVGIWGLLLIWRRRDVSFVAATAGMEVSLLCSSSSSTSTTIGSPSSSVSVELLGWGCEFVPPCWEGETASKPETVKSSNELGFYLLSHKYRLFGTFSCPFAVCGIWYNIKHEAMEKHAEPKWAGGGLLNSTGKNHFMATLQPYRVVPCRNWLHAYLCCTAEIWHRHSRDSMTGNTTAHTNRRDAWLSSAKVTVKQAKMWGCSGLKCSFLGYSDFVRYNEGSKRMKSKSCKLQAIICIYSEAFATVTAVTRFALFANYKDKRLF